MTTMPYREDIKITPRKVSFEWDGVTPHLIPGDPVSSHVLNALHLMFPAGENWFCKVFAEAMPYLEDNPKLKADAIAFMRQEAMHSRAHKAVVDHYEALGINAVAASERMEQVIMAGGSDKIFGLVKPWNEKMARWWLCRRLCAVAAVEHFTCIMGVWALEQTTLDASGIDPKMLDLFKWHCAEEIEHRNVAYDVFVHVSGDNHWMRYMTMPMVMVAVFNLMRVGASHLAQQDRAITEKFKFWKAWRRADKLGLMPSPTELVKSTKRWFTKKYDPQIEAETQLALDYFAVSPAAQGAS